jgi:CubicO group peptidase (beta-lactamase class C family)
MKLSGFVKDGFEAVEAAFVRNFDEGLELGAGFAAWAGDDCVVDLRGGWSDRDRTRPWDDRTLCPVYSTTKPVAALVIAHLVDGGLLDFEAPVARYWPAFAAGGKGGVSLAQALSHQAGIPGFPDPIDPDLWLDPPALAARLAELTPMWAIGDGSGYHPLTWGYIAGEVARRAAGRTLGTVLREDICTPLGIDFWIGTPPSEHPRCAEMLKPREPARFAARNAALEAAFLKPWSSPQRGGALWRETEIPSANGHGGARATARLYSAFALKGRIGGVRLFSEEVWSALTRERVSGADRILPGRISFASGVMRNIAGVYGPNPQTLGHSGWGGSGGFGDPDTGLAAAYVMNRQGADLVDDPRRRRLIDALYSCL